MSVSELPRVAVYDSHGQPKDVHVHDAHTTRHGHPVLVIDGQLFVVCEVDS